MREIEKRKMYRYNVIFIVWFDKNRERIEKRKCFKICFTVNYL